MIYFLVNKLTNEKNFFWLAMFYQKISLNVTFDFRDPYRPLKAVKQKIWSNPSFKGVSENKIKTKLSFSVD